MGAEVSAPPLLPMLTLLLLLLLELDGAATARASEQVTPGSGCSAPVLLTLLLLLLLPAPGACQSLLGSLT